MGTAGTDRLNRQINEGKTKLGISSEGFVMGLRLHHGRTSEHYQGCFSNHSWIHGSLSLSLSLNMTNTGGGMEIAARHPTVKRPYPALYLVHLSVSGGH